MTKRKPDLVKEKKEQLTYVLFYFFLTSFFLKAVFGMLSGSKCLLVSGAFSLFGLFIAVVTLLRIGRSHPTRRGAVHFNPDKLEFIIILGISIIITLSTSSLLFSIGHLVFFHTLYPPEMLAAWIAMITASLNLALTTWIKKRIFDLPEMDAREIFFVLNTDFLLSIMTSVAVVISRTGSYILDYACAIFTAFFLILYGISFLAAAFKGLMDASCDTKTVSIIEGLLRKAHSDVMLKTLRVHKAGHVFEIMAILAMGSDTPMPKALAIVQNTKEALRKKFLQPHELFVGIAQREKE